MVKKKTKNMLWGSAVLVIALFIFGVVSVSDGSLQFKNPLAGKLPGLSLAGVDGVESQQMIPVESLILSLTEKYSESPSNANGGNILIYTEGTDPRDPSANALATITIGTKYTTSDLISGKVYRVVYSNGTEAYSEDLGDVVLVPNSAINANTGSASVDLTDVFGIKRTKVATLDDILDETSASLVNNQASTNVTDSSIEIGCDDGCSADDTLVYDESNADGQFFLDLTLGASGSQAELREPVICFVHDSTNPPEGNEITALTVQRQSGSDLGLSSSTDWVNVFANEECVKLSGVMESGISATYRFTFTISEVNLDENDEYSIVFDDLGSDRGKDVQLNLGATRDVVSLDAQA